MEERIKRPLYLAGEILAIVIHVVVIIYSAFTALALIVAGALAEGFSGGNAETALLGLMVILSFILCVLSLFGIVFSSIACARTGWDVKKFNSHKVLMIISVALCFLPAVVSVVAVVTQGNYLYALIAAVLAGAGLLILFGSKKAVIVDEKGKYIKTISNTQPSAPQTTAPDTSKTITTDTSKTTNTDASKAININAQETTATDTSKTTTADVQETATSDTLKATITDAQKSTTPDTPQTEEADASPSTQTTTQEKITKTKTKNNKN